MGNIASEPGGTFAFAGFPNYRIDLLAGTNVLASDNNSLLPGEGRFLTSTVSVNIGAAHPFLGQPLGIRLVNLNSAPGIEVNWDNVRLESGPLPTPPLRIENEMDLGRIRLSWPDELNGPWSLESVPALDEGASWSLLAESPVLNEGVWSVSTPTPAGTRFFRLR